jgi:hypothetical protein
VRWKVILLDGSGRHFEGVADSKADAYKAIQAEVVRCYPADEIVERRLTRMVP